MKMQLICLFAWVALALSAYGSQSIIWTDIDPDKQVWAMPPGYSYDLDMNNDAIVDFIFVGNGSGDFYIEPEGNNRVVQNEFSHVAPLQAGTIIGDPMESPNSWREGHTIILSCRDLGPPWGAFCIGEYTNQMAFVGLEFYADGDPYYGWLRLENPFCDQPGGIFYDYAYESTSGVGIVAGVVPEPSALCLFGLVDSVSLHVS